MFQTNEAFTQATAYNKAGQLYDVAFRSYWLRHVRGKYRLDSGELVTRYIRAQHKWEYSFLREAFPAVLVPGDKAN